MNSKPIFTSFWEIDNKLRILQLQRQIEIEEMKLHLKAAKNSLLPAALIGGVGKWSKRLLITYISSKILKKLG